MSLHSPQDVILGLFNPGLSSETVREPTLAVAGYGKHNAPFSRRLRYYKQSM